MGGLNHPSPLDALVTTATGALERRFGRRIRLALEGLVVSVLGAVLAYRCLPAISDRGQAFYNDVTTQALGPDRHGLAQLLKDGVWPSWLRSAFGGEPYLANSQHGVLYPGNLPFLIFNHTGVALDVMIWLHIVVACLGAWYLVRVAWGRGFWGGAVAAVMFGLGSQVLTHTVLGDQLQGTALTPWVLAAAHLALERGRLRHVVGLAVAIGLQFLAGHPEMWLYTLGMVVTYALAWAIQSHRWWHAARQLAGGVLLFVLLFGWQLFPTLQLQQSGFRSSGGFHEQHPLPVRIGVDALLPDYGNVLVGENQAFVGVVGLVLFCLGMVASGRQLRWLRVWLSATALLGYVMALGNSNAFYRFLYDHAPLISSFRVPSRWLLLTNLAFALGAGLGADALLRDGRAGTLLARLRERAARLGAAGLVALIGTGFAFLLATSSTDGASTRRWVLAAVGTVVLWLLCTVPAVPRIAVAALLVLGSYKELSQARPFAEYRQKVPNIVYDDYRTNLRTIAAGGGRYLSDAVPANSTQRTEIVLPDGLSGIPALYYYVAVQPRLYARPNNQLGALADSVQGRDGGLVPTARWRDFYVNATGTIGNINAGQNIALPSQLHWDSLDLLAVEWFVAGDDLAASERAVLASHGFTVVGKDGYVELWRRVAPPLARLFHDVDVVASAQERVAKFSAGYPLLERAMVEESVQVKPQGTAGEYVQMGPPGRTTVRLTATVSSDALLVLADPYYPGWQATVDGRRVPILPVDSTFRGVRLTPGVHRVEFRYVDTPFRRGAALSLLTVIGLAGWTLIRRRRTSATR